MGCTTSAQTLEESELDRTITEKWEHTPAIIVPRASVKFPFPPTAPSPGEEFSSDLQNVLGLDREGKSSKIRVSDAKRVLIVGDHRVKVATARFIKRTARDVDVIVGVRDPSSSENASLNTEGVKLIPVNLQISSGSLYNAIKRLEHIDCAFIVSPATSSKIQETCQAVSALKRAGVSHVIVLSNTVVERSPDNPTIFGDQCRSIETYVARTGLSYTVVRVPIYMDNYCSQIDSIVNNSVFYRPVDAHATRNSICIADLAEAVGKMALRPIDFADQTLSLNGPQTSCMMAAEAFSHALGKQVVYEQVSRSAYKSMMLNSLIPEWQAEALLQMFESYEQREVFCLRPTSQLEALLQRPPTDIYAFARLVVQRLKMSGVAGLGPPPGDGLLPASSSMSRTNSGANLDSSSGLEAPSTTNSESSTPRQRSVSASSSSSLQQSAHDNLALYQGPSRTIRPSLDMSISSYAPQVSLMPQGIRGVLMVSIGLKSLGGGWGSRGSGLAGAGGGGDGSDDRSSTPTPAPIAVPSRVIKLTTASGLVGEIVLPDHTAAAATAAAAAAVGDTDANSEVSRSSHSDAGDKSAGAGAGGGGGVGRGGGGGGGGSSMKLNNYGSKLVLLLDGHMTYAPAQHIPASINGAATELLERGLCNKSISLSGFVVEQEGPTRFRLVGSRGEDVVYILEAASAQEADFWVDRLQKHVEWVDRQARSTWVY